MPNSSRLHLVRASKNERYYTSIPPYDFTVTYQDNYSALVMKEKWESNDGLERQDLQVGRFSILKMKGADGYEPDYTASLPKDSDLIK